MTIISADYKHGRYRIEQQFTGNSDAIRLPLGAISSVLVSSPSGVVNAEYSLSSLDDVEGGGGIWAETSIGDIDKNRGFAFDAPTEFVRFKAGAGVTYTVQILAVKGL